MVSTAFFFLFLVVRELIRFLFHDRGGIPSLFFMYYFSSQLGVGVNPFPILYFIYFLFFYFFYVWKKRGLRMGVLSVNGSLDEPSFVFFK